MSFFGTFQSACNPSAEAEPARRRRGERAALVAALLLAHAAAFVFLHALGARTAREMRVFPLDSYYYQSMGANLRAGEGPRVDWPQGPQNKYFPGYAAWRALTTAPGLEPDAALRRWVLPHDMLLLLVALGAFAFGVALWGDVVKALCLSLLTLLVPNVVKWAVVPMSETLALAAVCAMSAAAAFLAKEGDATPRRMRRQLLALLALAGAAGCATRVEAVYVFLALLCWLRARRRLGSATAAGIAAVALAPLAVWQAWARFSAGAANAYAPEGARMFSAAGISARALAMATQFFDSHARDAGFVGVAMLAATVLLLAALAVALRGFLSREARAAALLLLGYWLLHALWYYRSDRYSVVVAPFGLLVALEGLGRFVNPRAVRPPRWGRPALTAVVLLFALAFALQGRRAALAHMDILNASAPGRSPLTARLAHDALAGTPAPRVLAQVGLDVGFCLPGTVWYEGLDYVEPPHAPGEASAFIRRNGVTHLAVAPDRIAEWPREHGVEASLRLVYRDYGLALLAIERDGVEDGAPLR